MFQTFTQVDQRLGRAVELFLYSKALLGQVRYPAAPAGAKGAAGGGDCNDAQEPTGSWSVLKGILAAWEVQLPRFSVVDCEVMSRRWSWRESPSFRRLW